MAREKEDYRAILEDILACTGGKRVLSVAEASRYLGLDRRAVVKRYMPENKPISVCTLARRLCP
jgi:hypothetical protein